MLKHKITGIIMGALMLSGIVLGGSAIHNVKTTNDNTKVVNKVLLAAPSSTVGERAVVVNTDNSPLVLYSNASANSTITSYISVGEMLTIQSAGNNFYKVKVQETGAVGYISANNLQIITSGVNDAYNAVNKQGYIINVSSVVNLRANATMNSNVLAKLTNNTKINVLGKQGEWYKVSIGGKVGYIYQEYIGLDVSSNQNIRNSKDQKSTNINSTSNKNIKTGEKSNSDKACQITIKTINAQGQQVGAISKFDANDGSSITVAPSANVPGQYVSSILVNGVKSTTRTIKVNGPTNIIVKLSSYDSNSSNNEGNPDKSYQVTIKTINAQGQQVGTISKFNANDGSSITVAPSANVPGQYVSSILVNGVDQNPLVSRNVKIQGPTNIIVKLSSYDNQ